MAWTLTGYLLAAADQLSAGSRRIAKLISATVGIGGGGLILGGRLVDGAS